jgi:hypothetical protein
MKLKTLLQFLRSTTSVCAVVTPENHLNKCGWHSLTTAETAVGELGVKAEISNGGAKLHSSADFALIKSHTSKTALLSIVAIPTGGNGACPRSSWPFKVSEDGEKKLGLNSVMRAVKNPVETHGKPGANPRGL